MTVASFIEVYKLHAVGLLAYLTTTLSTIIIDDRQSRVQELRPWNHQPPTPVTSKRSAIPSQNVVQDLFTESVILSDRAGYLDLVLVEHGDFYTLSDDHGRDINRV